MGLRAFLRAAGLSEVLRLFWGTLLGLACLLSHRNDIDRQPKPQRTKVTAAPILSKTGTRHTCTG